MYHEIIFNSSTVGASNTPVFYLRKDIDCYAFKIHSVSIPFTFYSIDQFNNNVAFVEQNNATNTRIATLPSGSYNAASLEAALGQAMNTAGTQTYSVLFDDTTGKLTISAPTAFHILAGDNGSTAWNVLGISKATDSDTGTSVTLPSYVDFNKNTSILLCSSSLSSPSVIYAGNENLNVLCNIPVSVDSGAVIFWENTSGDYNLSETNLIKLDFVLLDSSNSKPINLNGGSFTVTLGIYTRPEDLHH